LVFAGGREPFSFVEIDVFDFLFSWCQEFGLTCYLVTCTESGLHGSVWNPCGKGGSRGQPIQRPNRATEMHLLPSPVASCSTLEHARGAVHAQTKLNPRAHRKRACVPAPQTCMRTHITHVHAHPHHKRACTLAHSHEHVFTNTLMVSMHTPTSPTHLQASKLGRNSGARPPYRPTRGASFGLHVWQRFVNMFPQYQTVSY
jgi:hypothetical protein